MIYRGNGVFILESGEPILRSCWNCNPAHKHLKKLNMLMLCIQCMKYYIYGEEINVEDRKKSDKIMQKHSIKKGESTRKVDLGYRITKISIVYK